MMLLYLVTERIRSVELCFLRASNVDRERFLRDLEEMHLQWFAAEDEGRTEDPTEHKVRKAREEGKVAKSQDVTSALLLLFTIVTIALLSDYLLSHMLTMVGWFVHNATLIDITEPNDVVSTFYGFFLRIMIPIASVALVTAIMANLVQVGPLFTLKAINPDFNKITPKIGKFIERSFLSTEALFNWFKNIGKVIILSGLAFLIIQGNIHRITNLLRVPFLQAFGEIARLAFMLLVYAGIILLVLSIFDFMFQRHLHRESLKMTRQEVKEERKTYEGDPMVKSRMKQRMQELLSRNMVQNVPEADVVVTNPTHYAVAMQYRRELMEAPTVIAKGADQIAFKIREVAEENSVPLIENKPLARALYAEVEIGDVIPEKFYEAVVAVLKQVYRMKGTRVG
jgi:flagellar biosynthesis protein FlhB